MYNDQMEFSVDSVECFGWWVWDVSLRLTACGVGVMLRVALNGSSGREKEGCGVLVMWKPQ